MLSSLESNLQENFSNSVSSSGVFFLSKRRKKWWRNDKSAKNIEMGEKFWFPKTIDLKNLKLNEIMK